MLMDILDVEGEKIKEALKPDSYIVFVFDEHNGKARHYEHNVTIFDGLYVSRKLIITFFEQILGI